MMYRYHTVELLNPILFIFRNLVMSLFNPRAWGGRGLQRSLWHPCHPCHPWGCLDSGMNIILVKSASVHQTTNYVLSGDMSCRNYIQLFTFVNLSEFFYLFKYLHTGNFVWKFHVLLKLFRIKTLYWASFLMVVHKLLCPVHCIFRFFVKVTKNEKIICLFSV